MSFTTEQRFKALEALIDAAKKQQDAQTASYLCKLGCVQVCGNLERCIELLISERFEKKTPPQIPVFLKRYFKRGTNYDCDEISNLLYKFDAGWGKSFEVFVSTNQPIKESISACYGLRNAIAHGGAQSLGYGSLQQYFNASRLVIEKIEEAMR